MSDHPFSGYLECGCINVQDEQRRCPKHPITIQDQFPVGSRVFLPSAKKYRFGVVTGYTTSQITFDKYVKIRREGLRTEQSYHPNLLMRI